jgi:hypothetical protein
LPAGGLPGRYPRLSGVVAVTTVRFVRLIWIGHLKLHSIFSHISDNIPFVKCSFAIKK